MSHPGAFIYTMGNQRPLPRSYGATAENQRGTLSQVQLRKIGLGKTAISRMVRGGLLERTQPAVYRVVGGADTWLGKHHQAILWGGDLAVVSHRSAAKLLGLEIVFDGVEITIPHNTRRPAPGVIVHYAKVCPEDVMMVHGLPCMKPARMLLTIGAVEKPHVAERLMDEALRKGLVTLEELRDVLRRLGGRGVRGVKVFRLLLEERGGAILDSELERLLWKVIKSSDLPLPQRQVSIGSYRVDFLYPAQKLIIEADSIAHHTEGPDFRKDRERQNELINGGWRILRFTWHDVKNRPDYVIETIRKALFFSR